jgi:hypothetical protein
MPFYKIYDLLYKNNFYLYCHLSVNKNTNFHELESDVLFLNRKFFRPQARLVDKSNF